ncbi:hypothetical protein ACJJV6_01605 [Arthrobacter nitrophenolicus]|uniref:hypothetical protein n=1 Tax=Arthrobacter nitrophenolicus TaxID=683150 RepID=UPI003899F32A
MKITMLPVAILIFSVLLLLVRDWRFAVKALIGFMLAVGGVFALLLVRGELQPYMQSLVLNAAYSQGSLVEGEAGTFVLHLLRVTSPESLSLVVVILLMVISVLVAHMRRGTGLLASRRSLILWASVGASFFGGLAVLGFTGLWHHHVQVLYVPAVLAIVGFMKLLQPVFNVRSALPAAAFTILAVLLGGQLSLGVYMTSVARSFSSMPQSFSEIGSIPSEARAVLTFGEQGTYARVGQNDDLGHAHGLRGWKLACPKFHQYPFDSEQTLKDASECLSNAQVIIVSPTAVAIPRFETWNSYLSRVEDILRLKYDCTYREQERVCLRRDA